MQLSSTTQRVCPASPVSVNASQPTARLVIVDDEPLSSTALLQFLQQAGYAQIVAMPTAGLRMQTLRDEQPDLLLLDLGGQEEAAFALLHDLQNDRRLRHVPAVLLCDHDHLPQRLRALALGVWACLPKPVPGEELLLRVHNLLLAKAYRDQLAHTDAITGLPNRDLLLLRTDWAVKQALRHQHVGAMLHIGLDRYQEINNALGPGVGDELLHAVAQRLVGGLRDSDMVIRGEAQDRAQDQAQDPAQDQTQAEPDVRALLARGHGDEFSILLPRLARAQDAGLVAQRLVASLSAPFVVAGHELFVSCHVGIAVFPSDGSDKNSVLHRAGVAMRSARDTASASGQQQRSVVQFDSVELNNQAVHRFRLERELRQALASDELRLHYQPQVNVQTGHICGAEALVRWQHPQRGLLGPGEFVEAAEELGLISALGDWVLHEALRQWAAWQQAGLHLTQISVNVSGLQLRQAGLADKVQAALRASGANPHALCLELTETSIIESQAQVAQTLRAIRALGVRLALDDFGTGYSSLTYLRRFEIDELKIDRSFVADCGVDGARASTSSATTSATTSAITAAIVVMARSLGLRVVAEGVETTQQLDFIRAQGVDCYQGYLFSKPLPAPAFAALLAQSSAQSLAPDVGFDVDVDAAPAQPQTTACAEVS
jgi:diguanylate cyclase